MRRRILLRMLWPLLITAILATLKWCKVITWSWWLVTAPVWFVVAFWLVVIIIVSVFGWIYNKKN